MIKNFIKQKLTEALNREIRLKFSMNVPEDIKLLNKLFKNNGYSIFIVGGAVRDSLLGKPIKDYDLVTDALPDEVEKILQKNGYKTLATGKSFGVINVFTDNDEYEIATFRNDQFSDNSDGRRPDSVVFSDMKQDSNRRDLSLNALYYDIDKGEIIDLVGGISDIKHNIVRTVGKPEDRFNEDKLRILRAIRFSVRYNSKVDSDVDKQLLKNSSLNGVSNERIRDELLKSIQSAQSIKFLLDLYKRYNLFKEIFKGLNVDSDFIEEKDYVILLAFLLRNNSVDLLKKQLNTLTYSSEEVKSISFLVSLLGLTIENAPLAKKLQSNIRLSDEQIKRFGYLVHEIDNDLLNAFIKYKLSVGGQDVINKFNVSGPEVGKMVNKLEIEEFKKLI